MPFSPSFVYSADGVIVDQVIARPRAMTIGGVSVPAAWFGSDTPDSVRRAIGVYRVTPGAVSDAHRETGRSYTRDGDVFIETIETEPAPAPSDAERAAGLRLSAAAFYAALGAAEVLDRSAMRADVEGWLVARIEASELDAQMKRCAVTLARKATRIHRADPDWPGLIEAVGAILPRADAQPGGLSSAEIDAIFLSAETGA